MKPCVLSESCVCPDDKIDFNGVCITENECPSCDGGYKEFEQWSDSKDPCLSYTCENGVIIHEKAICQKDCSIKTSFYS